MVPVLVAVNHLSVVVELPSCDGAEYNELLSAQKTCGVFVSVKFVEFPNLIDDSVGAVGVPPPTIA